ncbi:hypothetical protein D4R75_13645 [bacterium]|nr:MAG: hypothetical protein D4R75_13645 [bacterium]
MPRKKKQRDPEFSLHVFHHFDERVRKVLQVFLVQTTKEFTSFSYEILLDVAVQHKAIQLKILGLQTTPLLMPSIGPARGRRDFTDLAGSYVLNIMKLDGEMNEFQLDVTPSNLVIKGAPAAPFITASNRPVTLS